MTLEGFLEWARLTGAYHVTDAFERYKKFMEAGDGRQDKKTDKG